MVVKDHDAMNEVDPYVMNMDDEDEDEDDNYSGDDVYDTPTITNSPSGVIPTESQKPLTLDETVKFINMLQSITNMGDVDLYFKLTVNCLKDRLGNDQDILLGSKPTDTAFNALLSRLSPQITRGLSKLEGRHTELVDGMQKATLLLIWTEIEEKLVKEGIDRLELKAAIDGKYNYYPLSEDRGVTECISNLCRDWSENGQNARFALTGALKVLTDMKDLIKETKRAENPEQKAALTEVDLRYIGQLKSKGFKPITNDTDIYGRLEVHNTLLGMLRQFYKATPVDGLGYSDKVHMLNEAVILARGKNPKNADIWKPEIYMLAENLMFRTFIREDDASFTILIKLPFGLDNFNFAYGRSADLQSIPLLFSNMNASLGRTFSSSLIKAPRVCNLGKTRKVSCDYNCIEIILSKDLLAFKESSWALRDYIKACKGVDNCFSSFDDLSLGTKLVVGVMPGSLKAERFDCSGKYNVSGIVGGGAGSGKTAMYDSLIVQGTALTGVEGNGAIILVDPKQEWVHIWKNIFASLRVPFYGFDGSVINSSELKWVVDRKGTKIVEEIPFKVSSYIGGILFIRVIYEIIQIILKETGCSDIIEFNSGSHNYKGIKKLPRTIIPVDELNTLYANLSDKSYPKELYKGLIIARLTRTSGFIWLLGGQDPSKTTIPSDERNNYGYNIFGKMDADRYEYFNVVQNQAVVDYEQRNGTQDNPNPILSQGMFYAGPQKKTDLVKCLYVPKNERLEALKDLQIEFDGMFELHALVKLALKEGYFDNLETTLKAPNNIIYATLKTIGIITQQEFSVYSERVLNGTVDYPDDDLNDALRGNFGGQSGNTGETNQNSSDDASSFSQGQGPQANLGNSHEPPSEDKYIPLKERIASDNVYSDILKLPYNPFTASLKARNPFSTITELELTSSFLLTRIKEVFLDFRRVESISISISGLITINGVDFKPQFEQHIIDTMPRDIQKAVSAGLIAELFCFGDLKKFKNLVVLEVDSGRLAENRMRREMNIAPKEPWDILFDRFDHLKFLIIAGEHITDRPSAEAYQRNGQGGYATTEYYRNMFKVARSKKDKENKVNGIEKKDSFMDTFLNDRSSGSSPSYMSSFWNANPTKTVRSAVAWTAVVKLSFVAATIFGPFGLVFAALAAAGAYKQAMPVKAQQVDQNASRRKPNNQQSNRNTNSRDEADWNNQYNDSYGQRNQRSNRNGWGR